MGPSGGPAILSPGRADREASLSGPGDSVTLGPPCPVSGRPSWRSPCSRQRPRWRRPPPCGSCCSSPSISSAPDRLDPALPGGLGRLAREGRVFSDGALAHGMTETCPGHATMLTGQPSGRRRASRPTSSSIESGAEVYCACDPSEGAPSSAERAASRRRTLRVTALGDWLKAASPASRVFSGVGQGPRGDHARREAPRRRLLVPRRRAAALHDEPLLPRRAPRPGSERFNGTRPAARRLPRGAARALGARAAREPEDARRLRRARPRATRAPARTRCATPTSGASASSSS